MISIADRYTIAPEIDEAEIVRSERWFVIRTSPHRESGANLQLKAQNFQTFLPTCTKTVRHARKLRTVCAPFFPNYLFVRLDLDRDRWRSILGTFGVSSMIMAGDRPEPVPHGVVEALLERADFSGKLHLGDGLHEGQTVRVMAGPFADTLGYLERLDANGRVRVLLDIMGGQVPVMISRSALRAA